MVDGLILKKNPCKVKPLINSVPSDHAFTLWPCKVSCRVSCRAPEAAYRTGVGVWPREQRGELFGAGEVRKKGSGEGRWRSGRSWLSAVAEQFSSFLWCFLNICEDGINSLTVRTITIEWRAGGGQTTKFPGLRPVSSILLEFFVFCFCNALLFLIYIFAF